MAPQQHTIYEHLKASRDAKAAADMIFAHDAKASRHLQLFSQMSSLFVADSNNRRKAYLHELLDMQMEIQETHPEDADRLFKFQSLGSEHEGTAPRAAEGEFYCVGVGAQCTLQGPITL
jgi:hypothetical protein